MLNGNFDHENVKQKPICAGNAAFWMPTELQKAPHVS